MEPTVSPATVHAIGAYVRRRGLSIAVTERTSRYPLSEVVELWSRAERTARDPRIGRNVAALVPFGAFGAVEHLMMLSGTLADALERLVRLYPTVNQAFALTLRSSGDRTALELHSQDGAKILPAYADFVLTSIRRRIDAARGGIRHGIQTIAASHLLIDRECMHGRLPFADEELCEVIESANGQRCAPARTADLVAGVIATTADSETLSLTIVAGRLGSSARTLQRHLVGEGTSFRRVLDDARRNTAIKLLRKDLPTKAIADRLGFADVRSFHRAFRRWTQSTPHRYKMSQ